MLPAVALVLLSQFQPSQGGLGLRGTAAAKAPQIQVQIESDSPNVTLYRHLGQQVGTVWTGQGTGTVVINHYREECKAPCGETLEQPGDRFFLAGDGVAVSDAFTLTEFAPSVTLKVKAGSAWRRMLGGTLLVTGISFALVGGLMWGLSALLGGTGTVRNPYGTSTSSGVLSTIGLGGLVGGGVMLLGGIPLFAFGGTKVEFLPGLPLAPAMPNNTADL